MPTMFRGYNDEGESQVFADRLPSGWHHTTPKPEPEAEQSEPKKRGPKPKQKD